MNFKKILAIIATSLIISGCQSFGDTSKDLTPGVNKNTVEEKLGKPDAFKPTQNGYVYIYRNRLMSMNAWVYADYYYFFDKKNKLIAIEQGGINDKTQQQQQAFRDLQNSLNQQEMIRLEQNRQNMQMFQNSQPKKIIICNPRQIGCY